MGFIRICYADNHEYIDNDDTPGECVICALPANEPEHTLGRRMTPEDNQKRLTR